MIHADRPGIFTRLCRLTGVLALAIETRRPLEQWQIRDMVSVLRECADELETRIK